MILGIDEAGRGPVIGDMVIAGLLIAEDELANLLELGVKDSKLLSQKKRIEIDRILRSRFKHFIIRVSPREIDEAVRNGRGLNHLEGIKYGEIVDKLKPRIVYADCADVNPAKFTRYICSRLDFKPEVIARHKADVDFPVVGGASIIAKVERERIMENIRKEFAHVGSGYPSDKKTINFLEEYYKENRGFPEVVRRSWKTVAKFNLLTLEDF